MVKNRVKLGLLDHFLNISLVALRNLTTSVHLSTKEPSGSRVSYRSKRELFNAATDKEVHKIRQLRGKKVDDLLIPQLTVIIISDFCR